MLKHTTNGFFIFMQVTYPGKYTVLQNIKLKLLKVKKNLNTFPHS
jgi:hypothetical protein